MVGIDRRTSHTAVRHIYRYNNDYAGHRSLVESRKRFIEWQHSSSTLNKGVIPTFLGSVFLKLWHTVRGI